MLSHNTETSGQPLGLGGMAQRIFSATVEGKGLVGIVQWEWS